MKSVYENQMYDASDLRWRRLPPGFPLPLGEERFRTDSKPLNHR